jgi:hypothetical protein
LVDILQGGISKISIIRAKPLAKERLQRYNVAYVGR